MHGKYSIVYEYPVIKRMRRQCVPGHKPRKEGVARGRGYVLAGDNNQTHG